MNRNNFHVIYSVGHGSVGGKSRKEEEEGREKPHRKGGWGKERKREKGGRGREIRQHRRGRGEGQVHERDPVPPEPFCSLGHMTSYFFFPFSKTEFPSLCV